MNRLYFVIGGLITATAMLFVSCACPIFFYQPKIPKSLR
ncbi:cyclic lactone autoinducer peptide [Anaerobacterium chartisolvens]